MSSPTNVLTLEAVSPPLRVDDAGVVRVGAGRVTLDLVVAQYENGMTPEEMVRAYDTLVLAEVYAVLSYYLEHRDEVLAYLKSRSEEAASQREGVEASRVNVSRSELLERKQAREQAHAATRQ